MLSFSKHRNMHNTRNSIQRINQVQPGTNLTFRQHTFSVEDTKFILHRFRHTVSVYLYVPYVRSKHADADADAVDVTVQLACCAMKVWRVVEAKSQENRQKREAAKLRVFRNRHGETWFSVSERNGVEGVYTRSCTFTLLMAFYTWFSRLTRRSGLARLIDSNILRTEMIMYVWKKKVGWQK